MTTYAVNRKTKEHRIAKTGESWYHPWQLLSADKDGWVEWFGGECPLPCDAECEVRQKDGSVSHGEAGKFEAGQWEGKFFTVGGPIIAYRPILSADTKPEPPAWDGEGLPPVGCECEWSDSGRPHKRVLVMGHYGESVWLRIMDSQTPITVHAHYDSFRPIRSEEDRAVDEMVKSVCGSGDYTESLCRALYRAGYRKTGGEG